MFHGSHGKCTDLLGCKWTQPFYFQKSKKESSLKHKTSCCSKIVTPSCPEISLRQTKLSRVSQANSYGSLLIQVVLKWAYEFNFPNQNPVRSKALFSTYSQTGYHSILGQDFLSFFSPKKSTTNLHWHLKHLDCSFHQQLTNYMWSSKQFKQITYYKNFKGKYTINTYLYPCKVCALSKKKNNLFLIVLDLSRIIRNIQ